MQQSRPINFIHLFYGIPNFHISSHHWVILSVRSPLLGPRLIFIFIEQRSKKKKDYCHHTTISETKMAFNYRKQRNVCIDRVSTPVITKAQTSTACQQKCHSRAIQSVDAFHVITPLFLLEHGLEKNQFALGFRSWVLMSFVFNPSSTRKIA